MGDSSRKKKRSPARTTQDSLQEYDTSYLESTSSDAAGVSRRWLGGNGEGGQQGGSSLTGPNRNRHKRIHSDTPYSHRSPRNSLAKPLNAVTRSGRRNHEQGTTSSDHSGAPLLSVPFALRRDESYPMNRSTDRREPHHDDERCPTWTTEGACTTEDCPCLSEKPLDPENTRSEAPQPDSSSTQYETMTTSFDATRVISGGVRLGVHPKPRTSE